MTLGRLLKPLITSKGDPGYQLFEDLKSELLANAGELTASWDGHQFRITGGDYISIRDRSNAILTSTVSIRGDRFRELAAVVGKKANSHELSHDEGI